MFSLTLLGKIEVSTRSNGQIRVVYRSLPSYQKVKSEPSKVKGLDKGEKNGQNKVKGKRSRKVRMMVI